ncbi:MAG TPA: hypothetical protein VE783_08265 [Candidatus Limnocylindrales bacterium]|nr:hypothetical protein [Candidatus Limnocylindrales bacterium]
MRLDYLSCLLTIGSTVLIGRRVWQGWLVAGINSAIICCIGLRTGQWGFVPANLFCIAIYVYNVRQWRREEMAPAALSQTAVQSDRLIEFPAAQQPESVRPHHPRRRSADERTARNRIRERAVSDRRESRTSL